MNLIMVYEESDGYTYSCEHIYPFEYDSIEQAEYDFLTLWENCESHGCFKFLGQEFDWSLFVYYSDYETLEGSYSPPCFYTLESWFERNKLKGNSEN